MKAVIIHSFFCVFSQLYSWQGQAYYSLQAVDEYDSATDINEVSNVLIAEFSGLTEKRGNQIAISQNGVRAGM